MDFIRRYFNCKNNYSSQSFVKFHASNNPILEFFNSRCFILYNRNSGNPQIPLLINIDQPPRTLHHYNFDMSIIINSANVAIMLTFIK